jgi:hypothetical protein
MGSENQTEISWDLIDCIFAVHDSFDCDLDKMMAWFHTENHNFGGFSPADLFARGKGHKVLEFVRSVQDRGFENERK